MNDSIAGFSADTEILTRGGWMTSPQLTLMDEVATRSPDGVFEWRYPQAVSTRRYDGAMVRMLGRSLNMLVAPGTPVLHVADARGPERVRSAAEVVASAVRRSRVRNGVTLIATSRWQGAEFSGFTAPGVRRSKMGPRPRDFPMTGDQYAAFMGMYIAEGNVGCYGDSGHVICITQMEHGKGYGEYRALLTEILGREPGRCGNFWRFHSRALYEYLHPFGKALVKWLPAEVLDMSQRQLAIFWRYYFLGDGSLECNGARAECVATGSPRLAGQLQEIVQKLGSSGSVRRYAHRPNELVRAEGCIYKVRVRKTVRPSCAVRAVAYSGLVANVTVGEGAVYVRRDGKAVWC